MADFNSACADWVYDTIVKMDDAEAETFALLVAHDLWTTDIQNNARWVERYNTAQDRAITEDVAKALLEHLDNGGDPEQAVAMAAAVGIAKADHDAWRFQERDKGGRFGRMTGAQYRAQKKVIQTDNIGNKAARLEELRDERKGYHRGPSLGDINAAGGVMASRVGRFEQDWNRAPSESGATDTLGRLRAGGSLVQDLGAASGNPKVAVAGAVANYAGQFGPEAEKVVGPSLRRAAYRYRGTERTPDKELTTLQAYELATQRKRSGKDTRLPVSPAEKAAATEDASVRYFVGGYKVGGADEKSKSRIPNSQLAGLQQASGRITPSEGIMIDAQGNVVHQAIGYGEDHYLPFNLKNLGALKGGSYVRTRESGGPTTEDIYTGLLSGARSMTVVSNSGIFTVDFADDLRGGRRYNDKAHQMVGRYGKTLDAVQSKKVENPKRALSPREKAQIRIEAEDKINNDPMLKFATDDQKKEWVETELKRAMEKPRLTPQQEERLANLARQGARNEAEARVHYREMRDEALEKINTRNYQLDGEGYAASLDALREQFPYYIADVRYQTKTGSQGNARSDLGEAFNTGVDSGYVKPRFNRPGGAREGYYDESITGRGKQGADTINYQNMRGRNGVRANKPKEESEGSEGGEGKPAANSMEAMRAKMRDADRANIDSKAEKAALVSDLKEWGALDADAKKNDTDAGLTEAKYPIMNRFFSGDDGVKDFLASDPEYKKKLYAEMKLANDDFKGSGVRLPDALKAFLARTSKTELTDELLASSTSPAGPLRISDEVATRTIADPNFKALLAMDDTELASQAQAFRDQRSKLKTAGNDGDDYKFANEQVRRFETARGAKLWRSQQAEVSDSDYARLEGEAASNRTLKPLPKVRSAENERGDRLRSSLIDLSGDEKVSTELTTMKLAQESGAITTAVFDNQAKRIVNDLEISTEDKRRIIRVLQDEE